MIGGKINRVDSYEVCSNVTSKSWLGRSLSMSKSRRFYSDLLFGQEVSKFFCDICIFLCLLFSAAILHCVGSLQGQLTPITNTHQTKLTFNKRWKSGLGLSPRFKPFWKGVRGESLKKNEMSIVSLTLRECLGLSFQGIYIYLFIQYYHYYYYYFHNSVWSNFNSRGRNSERGGATLAHI